MHGPYFPEILGFPGWRLTSSGCTLLNAVQVQFECSLGSFRDHQLVDPLHRTLGNTSMMCPWVSSVNPPLVRRPAGDGERVLPGGDQERGECVPEIMRSKRTHIRRCDRAMRRWQDVVARCETQLVDVEYSRGAGKAPRGQDGSSLE